MCIIRPTSLRNHDSLSYIACLARSSPVIRACYLLQPLKDQVVGRHGKAREAAQRARTSRASSPVIRAYYLLQSLKDRMVGRHGKQEKQHSMREQTGHGPRHGRKHGRGGDKVLASSAASPNLREG